MFALWLNRARAQQREAAPLLIGFGVASGLFLPGKIFYNSNADGDGEAAIMKGAIEASRRGPNG
ncbi:hypothetical protein C4577_07585 [Candidatus Parcubacteria bacterium]|nr:MAG: hypothetical protein C4577_07585 [Candidatus Parcubacteria bacterium]